MTASRTGPARPVPQDLEAEKALLSATLQSRAALEAVAHTVRPEHFYAREGALLWAAELELLSDGKPIDWVTVTSLLRSRGQLDRVGGVDAVRRLTAEAPDVAHAAAYAAAVRGKAKQRASLELLQRLASEAHGDVGDVDAWLDRVEDEVHAVAIDHVGDARLWTMRDAVHEVYQRLDREDGDPGVRTGLIDLDAVLGPMLPGHMVVLAAASGAGKSALGMQWAVNVAQDRGTPQPEGGASPAPAVLVFSLEMQRRELAKRALFTEARVDGTKAANPKRIATPEWQRLAMAAEAVALPNVYLDDRSGLAPTQIRATARRVQARARRDGFELRVLVVDYVQLVDATGDARRPTERRERELASASVALKNLAKDLGLPVVVLAQINDDPRRERRLPTKEDLRECKAIGNDADKVVLLHNPSAVARRQTRRTRDEVDGDLAGELVDLIIDKNRGGREGRVSVLFFPSLTLFADASPEDIARLAPRDREEASS